jgi:hypothetical protein
MIIIFLVLLLIPVGILLLPFSIKRKLGLLASLLIITGIAITVSIPHLRKTNPLFNLFFSPPDLYATLAETTFSTSDENSSYKLDFTAKYPGRHTVTIIPSVPIKTMESYGEEFSVRVLITNSSGEVLVDDVATPPYSQFWGKETGLFLFTFNVPKDVPLHVPLNASVQITEVDHKFEEKFGPITLSINKGSDE